MLRLVRRDETYFVNERDQIFRVGRCATQPSDGWRLLGAVEYRVVFGNLVAVRRYSVKDIREGRVPWKYKNGKQRCYVVDFDHGSRRVWMHPGDYYATGIAPSEVRP